MFRKGTEPSASVFSAVNCMPSSMELIWFRNSSLYADLMTTCVIHISFPQTWECDDVLRALPSNSSIYNLATMELTGNFMAAPSSFS